MVKVVDAAGRASTLTLGSRAMGGRKGLVSGIFVQQDSKALMETLEYMSSLAIAIDEMMMPTERAGIGSSMSRGVKSSIQEAWQYVAEDWASDVEGEIHKLAMANKSFPHNHWTRHLYTGGNPAYAGHDRNKLFRFNAVGRSSGIKINIKAIDDMGHSFSPLTEGVRRQGNTRELNAKWEERSQFMLGLYAGGQKDAMRLFGHRTKQDLQNGLPLYISGFTGGTGFTLSDKFSKDYSSIKATRDRDLNALAGDITAAKVMAGLDKSGIEALRKSVSEMERVASKAASFSRMRGWSPVSSKMSRPAKDFRGGKGPAYASSSPASQRAAKTFSSAFVNAIKRNFSTPATSKPQGPDAGLDEVRELMGGG